MVHKKQPFSGTLSVYIVHAGTTTCDPWCVKYVYWNKWGPRHEFLWQVYRVIQRRCLEDRRTFVSSGTHKVKVAWRMLERNHKTRLRLFSPLWDPLDLCCIGRCEKLWLKQGSSYDLVSPWGRVWTELWRPSEDIKAQAEVLHVSICVLNSLPVG